MLNLGLMKIRLVSASYKSTISETLNQVQGDKKDLVQHPVNMLR